MLSMITILNSFNKLENFSLTFHFQTPGISRLNFQGASSVKIITVSCRNRDIKSLDYFMDGIKDNMAPFDMKYVINRLVDNGQFFELKPDYAKNIITGFGRFEGKSVAIIANQPLVQGGCLDIHSSLTASRFVRFADCFNIPILTLVDVPEFLPGIFSLFIYKYYHH